MRVEVGGEAGLVMDLSGCEAFLAHRYGHATRRDNEAALIRHLEASLARLGFAARAAVAPTVGLAWAACRFGDESIEAAAPSVGGHVGSALHEAIPTTLPPDDRAERHSEAATIGNHAAAQRLQESQSIAERSREEAGSNRRLEADRGSGRAAVSRTREGDRTRRSTGARLPRIVEREAMAKVLAAMPIEALRLDEDSIEGFRQLSIDRIESLLPLDRDEVTARFGPLVAWRLDEALGLRDEAITPVRVEPPIEVTRTFATPVASQEGVRLAVQAMLAELCRRLRRRERGAVRLRLEAARVDRGVESIDLSLGAPSRRAGHLAALLEPKIERLDVGLGLERLTLVVLRSGRLPHRQKDFGFGCGSETAPEAKRARHAARPNAAEVNAPACELADALIARFGERAVRSPHATESPLPEAAEWRSADLHGEGASIEWGLAPRPSRLTDPPEPVFIEFEADAESPPESSPASTRHAPASTGEATGSVAACAAWAARDAGNSAWAARRGRVFRWRGIRHRIERWIGPERVAEAWWRRDEDAPVGESIATREYWRVRLASGWWVWLFRHVVESADESERLGERHATAGVEARGSEATEGGGRIGAAGDAQGGMACGREGPDEEPGEGPVEDRLPREPCVDGLVEAVDEAGPRIAVDRWFLHGVWS